MKKLLIYLVLLAAIVIVLIFVVPPQESTLVVPNETISLIVVDTPALRERGLSGMEKLPEDTAMLFVFEREDRHAFWMKDMKFPIDIVWLDESFKIIHTESDVSPATFPRTFAPPEKARYVLEANAFFTLRNNLKTGDILNIVLRK